MILYDNSEWIRVVFKVAGSVWPNIRMPFLFWTVWVLGSYALTDWMQKDLGNEGHTILGTTMSFLLIFRANQAHARYWQGRTVVSMFFADIRDLIQFSMLYIHGGVETATWLNGGRGSKRVAEDQDDQKARDLRVNVVRLSIALAVVLKSYTRISVDGYCFGSIDKQTKWQLDWDRFRLMQLLDEEEFRMLDDCVGIIDPSIGRGGSSLQDMVMQFKGRVGDGPPSSWPDSFKVEMRPRAHMHVVIVYLLRELLIANMNEFHNNAPWGIKERFLPLLSRTLFYAQSSFEVVIQIMTTPLPLPYACVCKTLLSFWMASFPFVVDFKLGYFGSIIVPILVALALLGIDAISTELENPFGDDANDLDLVELIHNLESEAMEMLKLVGDHKGRARFIWRRMPDFVSESSCKPITKQLAVAGFAADEVVPHSGSNMNQGE